MHLKTDSFPPMSHQLSHQENKFTSKEFEITLLCDHLESPANQGALFRICEAFHVHHILFYGNTIDLKSSRLKRTARSTEKRVTFSHITNLNETLIAFKKSNTLLLGLEITANSVPIQKLTLKKESKIVLVIGSEKSGISQEILNHLDTVYHIPMYGSNSSMNVIQAAGIALFSVTNALNTALLE